MTLLIRKVIVGLKKMRDELSLEKENHDNNFR